MKKNGLWKEIHKYDKGFDFSDLSSWNGTNGYRARRNIKKTYRRCIKRRDRLVAKQFIKNEIEDYGNK